MENLLKKKYKKANRFLKKHKQNLKEFAKKKRQTFKFWGFDEVKFIYTAAEYKKALGKWLGDVKDIEIPEKIRVHYFGNRDIMIFTPVGENA